MTCSSFRFKIGRLAGVFKFCLGRHFFFHALSSQKHSAQQALVIAAYRLCFVVMCTMAPKEGQSSDNVTLSNPYAVRLGSHHSQLVNVSRRSFTRDVTYSVKSTVEDMEEKIMEKVSLLTLDSSNEVEEATEVSFTVEDLTGLTDTATKSSVAPFSCGTTLIASSPIRPRAKRTVDSLTTPTMNDVDAIFEDLSTNLGPRRKRRRVPGTLADAPRLPSSFDSSSNHHDFSPFHIYDKRLEGLVSRLTTNEVPSLTTSPLSPIESSSDEAQHKLLLPPVLSWMKPRTARRYHHSRRRPTPRRTDLTPLESLALEMEASPIVLPILH